MSKAVLVPHGDGAQPTRRSRTETAVQVLSASFCRRASASHHASAMALTDTEPPLIDSEGSRRGASVSDRSPSRMLGGVQPLQFRATPIPQGVAVGGRCIATRSTDPCQQGSPLGEFPVSKGQRFDPLAMFGRPTREERLAKSPPTSEEHPNGGKIVTL